MNRLVKNHRYISFVLKALLLVFLFFAVLLPVASAQTIKQNPPAPTPAPVNTANKPGGAGESIQKLICSPTEPGQGSGKSDLYACINNGYKLIIVLGSLGAVFWIIVAGYLYMASDGSQESITKAKEIMVSTVAGIFIILMTFVFLRQINPEIVNFPAIDLQTITNTSGLLSPYEECYLRNKQLGKSDSDAAKECQGLSTSPGDGPCAMPIDETKASGLYNSTKHNPWDDNPDTPDRHRTARKPPNAPPPEGAVDVRMKNSGVPVYSPISGKVDLRRDPPDFPGEYISISSNGDGCSAARSCATLAHISPSVSLGAVVTAGQQIGVVFPNTGSLGPVVHMELKLGGQWITGDGKGTTWTNMKAAIGRCSGSGGGSAPAGMVAVKGIAVDMQYASANPSSHNFMKKALYTGANAKYGTTCYLKEDAAKKVEKAQEELNKVKPGWKIKAWDCYRPPAVQKEMYDWAQANGLAGLVAHPDRANHPQGGAIDATLVDASGRDVQMPTHFDLYDSKKPHDQQRQRPGSSAYNQLPAAARANAEILNSAMKKAGLNRVANEWWHFD